MSTLPVSVIIPAYNAERFIRQAIESVRAQTQKVGEIIVIDNNCTDRTRQIADELGAVVVKEKKQSLSAARNAGIKAARFEWIALIDADDLWKKKKIEFQWQLIQSCPEARVILCDFTFLNAKSNIKFNIKKRHPSAGIKIGKHFSYFPNINAVLLDNFGFLPSCAIINREVFSGIGLFDETVFYQEDVEFFMRAAARYPFAFVRKRLVYYCRHNENMTNNINRMDEFLKLVTEKMLKDPDNYAEGAGKFYLDKLKSLFVAKARVIAQRKTQSIPL